MSLSSLNRTELCTIKQLFLNARIPISKIAKISKRSQQNISYSVSSLLKKGVIQNFYSLIDYSKLGVLSFRVFFKINYIGKKNFQEFIDALKSRQDTAYITTCGSDFDLIAVFFAKNPSSFNKNLKSILADYPKLIQDYTILTTIVIRSYSKEEFPKRKELFLGGDREIETLDLLDTRLLNQLSNNARTSSLELSSKLSVVPRTIINRIKRLEADEYILGYRPLINFEKTNQVVNLLLIRYHNITVETENRLINFLKQNQNIISLTKTLGQWDLEIEIETKNTSEFRKIEMEIREKFTSLIHEIRTIPIYEVHKKNFFPQFLLDEPKSPL